MPVATRRRHNQAPSTPKTTIIMPCCGEEHKIALPDIIQILEGREKLPYRHCSNSCNREVTFSLFNTGGQNFLRVETVHTTARAHQEVCLCCKQPFNPNVVGAKKCPHCKATMNLLLAKDGKSKMIELISVLVPI